MQIKQGALSCQLARKLEMKYTGRLKERACRREGILYKVLGGGAGKGDFARLVRAANCEGKRKKGRAIRFLMKKVG